MNQNNRNNCSCEGLRRSEACSYGRTPWGTREGTTCYKRPWNTRSSTCPRTGSACASCARNTANTTWKNRCEGCTDAVSSSAPRGTCSCGEALNRPRETCSCGEALSLPKESCSCDASRTVEEKCACNRGAKNNGILSGESLAMVYSPYQEFNTLYDPRRGLCSGTIFGDLDKPFHGNGRGL